MKIAAETKLKNHTLREARLREGLSQRQLGDMVGVSHCSISALERLQFANVSIDTAVRIAAVLDLELSSIYPEMLRGVKFPRTFTGIADVPEEKLLAAASSANRRLLSAPVVADIENEIDASEAIDDMLSKCSHREREIIKLRYALGDDKTKYTLEECGKIFKISREQVRQIEARTIRRMQQNYISRNWREAMYPDDEE